MIFTALKWKQSNKKTLLQTTGISGGIPIFFIFMPKRYVKEYLHFIIQYLFDEISNVPWIAPE